MLDLEKIKRYLSMFSQMSMGDIYHLFTIAKERKLKAGDIYLSTGQMSRKVAYIKSGIIRGFAIKQNGEEATLILRYEDQFIASYDCLLRNEKSRSTYHALEDTVLLEVDFDAIIELVDKNPKYHEGRRFFLSNVAIDLMDRMESFILLSPEERYQHFLNQHPLLAQRIHDKYIASYLGITPVSLSRIRKRISKRKN